MTFKTIDFAKERLAILCSFKPTGLGRLALYEKQEIKKH
jgi:hypothetical protein